MSADAMLAGVTRDQWSHYLQQFGPLEEKLLSETNDNSLVTNAARDSARQNAVAEQSFNRDMERYGVNITGVQSQQLKRMRALGDSANNTFSINNARLDQRDRNIALSGDLMQIGRGVAGQGMSGLGDVANMSAQRNAMNAQAKAQASSQRMSSIGGAIGAAGSALIMGSSLPAAAGLGALALL